MVMNSSPRISWQGGAGLQTSDSGQQVSSISLSPTFRTPRYSLSASGAINFTEIENNTTESLTGSASYNYSHKRFLFVTSISRSITDSLSYFEVTGLEKPFLQQQFIEADQLNINVSNIKPSDALNFSVGYSIGETKSLLEVEVVDLSQSAEVVVEQWNVQAIIDFSTNEKLTLSFSDRTEDDFQTQSISANVQKIFSSHWIASATVNGDLLVSSPLSWVLSVNYSF